MRKHQRHLVIAFYKAPFRIREPLWKPWYKGSPRWVVLSTQFLAFRQLSFQFGNTESYLLFLPFKSTRCFSCPLLMQSKKRFETLSRQESRESFSCQGTSPAGAQSQSKESIEGTCVRSWLSQQQCESHPCFPSMCGALGKGVALLEALLIEQVLCWGLTPGFLKITILHPFYSIICCAS